MTSCYSAEKISPEISFSFQHPICLHPHLSLLSPTVLALCSQHVLNLSLSWTFTLAILSIGGSFHHIPLYNSHLPFISPFISLLSGCNGLTTLIYRTNHHSCLVTSWPLSHQDTGQVHSLFPLLLIPQCAAGLSVFPLFSIFSWHLSEWDLSTGAGWVFYSLSCSFAGCRVCV